MAKGGMVMENSSIWRSIGGVVVGIIVAGATVGVVE